MAMRRRPSTDSEIWCGACQTMHPKPEFGKDRKSPDGLAYACKEIVKRRNSATHSKNRDINNKRHVALRKKRKDSEDFVSWSLKKMVSDAARRAKSKGMAFCITVKDIPAPTRCAVFGTELSYQAAGSWADDSASLDRIDNSRGYVPDNVWIISWRANRIKNDATANELRMVADAIVIRVGKKAAGRLLDGRAHDDLGVEA